MNAAEIAEAQALCDGATAGPWAWTCMGSEGYHVHEAEASEGKRRKRVALCTYEKWEIDTANANFISAARQGWPAALSAVVELTDENTRLRAVIEAVRALEAEFVSRSGYDGKVWVALSALQSALAGGV